MEYTNSQIKALISEHIHDELDRQMLLWRLVDGYTFEAILDKVFDMDKIRTVKTVRTRIHKGEAILFKHIPG